MSLEAVFQNLAKDTGITPKIKRKQGEPPRRRLEVPTVIWRQQGMRCWAEYNRFGIEEEELIVRIYREGESDQYSMTLWFANLREGMSPEYQANQTILEYLVGREPRIRMISESLLRAGAPQYDEILQFLQRDARTETEYRGFLARQEVGKFLTTICNPELLN